MGKTQCIFNSKDLHAATTGMVAASIVKSVQSINKMRALVEEGIAEKDWIAAIISNTFETGNPPKEGETDLDRGDFDVVKALIKKYPEMALGKILTDKMVDLAGQTGPHLYKCVTEMQAKMDATSGEEQMMLKKRLLNYLERDFYLVCFGAYCRQEGHSRHGGEGHPGLGGDHFLQPQHEHTSLVLLVLYVSTFSQNTAQPSNPK